MYMASLQGYTDFLEQRMLLDLLYRRVDVRVDGAPLSKPGSGALDNLQSSRPPREWLLPKYFRQDAFYEVEPRGHLWRSNRARPSRLIVENCQEHV